MNSRQLPPLAATKPAPKPTLSQFPSAPIAGRRGADEMQRISAEPPSDLKWKTLFSFGWKLIGICRGLVLLYVILSLTEQAIDRGVVQLFGYLTNHVSISSPINARTPPAGPGGLTGTNHEPTASPAQRHSLGIT